MKKGIIAVIAILVVAGAIFGITRLMSNNTENEIQAQTENNNEGLTANNNEENETNTNSENNTTTEGGKTLIAYFSRSGNTQTVANLIHENVGGDIFRIETVEAYPSDYTATTEVAKEEQDNNARPAITNQVENIEQYDTIYIGYPNWWGTMPMAIHTFLEQYNLDGKNIVPFCTHAGSGLGRSENDLKQAVPNANVLDGLAITGSNAESSATRTSVDSWIEGLDI